jgi:site-specific DNA-methyltransferase (adenine-specific)
MNLDGEHITGFCKKCGAWYGQLGLEPDFNLYLQHLWEIFDEVKRVLKPTGTLWVNLGDTYNNTPTGRITKTYVSAKGLRSAKKASHVVSRIVPIKCLCLIPERFAIGMVERGWILRNSIIWSKKVVLWDYGTQVGNGMPHSAKDRFNQNKEYVYFFVKSRDYCFKKLKIPYTREINRWGGSYFGGSNSLWDKLAGQKTGRKRNLRPDPQGAGAGDVWPINTRPFTAKKLGMEEIDHVAPFPEKLPLNCIEAGCPEDGIVMDIFLGSGTTAVAAEKLGRKWIGIELNPNYCEIAKRRIAKIAKKSRLF